MSLSRKRRRELKQLKKLTDAVLDEQRIVLGHAGDVLSEAGYQAKKLSDEHLAPRVANAYAVVRPTVDGVLARLRSFGQATGKTISPYTTNAVLRASAALEAADRKDLAKQLVRLGAKSGLVVVKKRSTVGTVVGIVAGVAAAAAVGYSLFQVFRDDEDVWVAPESE